MKHLILLSPIGYGIFLGHSYPERSPFHLRALLVVLVPLCIFLPIAWGGANDQIGWGFILAFMLTPIYAPIVLLVEHLVRKFERVESRKDG